MQPAIRPGVHKELAHKLGDALLDFVREAGRNAFPSCLSCVYFDETKAYCNGHRADPPPRVIVNGCAQYVDNDAIPF